MAQDGGYQEFMVARADYVLPLPDSLGFADAAPLMCAGLTVYSALSHAGFIPGDKVAIVGLGGLGTLAVSFARAMGGRIAVISSTRGKEAQARELGAEKFIHTGTNLLVRSCAPGTAVPTLFCRSLHLWNPQTRHSLV
jgi:D-arabinose 1-dehydrogenase-like Zn-dependent alcohol dehydrogenase